MTSDALRRLAAAVAACALLLLGTRAAADPAPSEPIHLVNGGEVTTPSGNHVVLPPGYYLPDEDWQTLDAEVRRLQDAETRLEAENQSFRESARKSSGWRIPAGVAAAVAGLLGLVVGTLWSH